MGFNFGSLGRVGGAVVGGLVGGPAGAMAGYEAGGMLGDSFGPSQERLDQRAYNQQYRDTVTLWNMNNEYNNPVNQMLRLKAADLNPALVYSDGNVTGNSSSAPSAPDYRTHAKSTGNAMDRFVQRMQLQQMKNDVSGSDLDNQMKTAQLEYLMLRNKNLTRLLNSGSVVDSNGENMLPVFNVDGDTTIEEVMDNPDLSIKEKRDAINIIKSGKDRTSFAVDPLAYIGRVFSGAWNYGSNIGLSLRNSLKNKPGWVVEDGFLPYKR